MSLRQLNKQIRQCSHDAEKQRQSLLCIADRQRQQVYRCLRATPLPILLGLAFVAGFTTEKLWRFPRTSQMVQLMRSLRAF